MGFVDNTVIFAVAQNYLANFSEIGHRLTYRHPHDACLFSLGLNNFWIFGELFCFSHVNEWRNLTWS